MILLVSATSFEIAPLLSHMEKKRAFAPNHTRYLFKGGEIDVLVTGIGMVATAFALGKVLATHSYHWVVNAGICGSFAKTLQIGQVVNVVSDCFPELGAEDGGQFLNLFQLGLDKEANLKLYASPHDSTLQNVTGVTVNTVHGNKESIKSFMKLHTADIETMEGAAVFYACKMANVPCVQICAVSNYVEARDKSKWNIPLAVKNLNEIVYLTMNGYKL